MNGLIYLAHLENYFMNNFFSVIRFKSMKKPQNIIHGYEQQYLPCVQSVFLYSVHDKELNVLPSKMTTLI